MGIYDSAWKNLCDKFEPPVVKSDMVLVRVQPNIIKIGTHTLRLVITWNKQNLLRVW